MRQALTIVPQVHRGVTQTELDMVCRKMNASEALRLLRKHSGLTLREAAKVLGVSAAVLTRLESPDIYGRLAKCGIARTAILADSKEKSRTHGVIVCPECGGVLSYSIASNGHIHASCNTGDCLNWME